MPDEPIDRILDAAYACFVRHGMRRTTMDDSESVVVGALDRARPPVGVVQQLAAAPAPTAA